MHKNINIFSEYSELTVVPALQWCSRKSCFSNGNTLSLSSTDTSYEVVSDESIDSVATTSVRVMLGGDGD
jgi:hypothetical protein